MEKDEKYWDQNAFNDILLSDAQDVPGRTDNLLKYAVLEAWWGRWGQMVVVGEGEVAWRSARRCHWGGAHAHFAALGFWALGVQEDQSLPAPPLAPPPPRIQPDACPTRLACAGPTRAHSWWAFCPSPSFARARPTRRACSGSWGWSPTSYTPPSVLGHRREAAPPEGVGA